MAFINIKYESFYLVDDSMLVNIFHKKLLQEVGVTSTIKYYTNPRVAFGELLQESYGDNSIFVILDMKMPGLSGLGFLERMVRSSMGLNIDVLIVTASENDNDRQLAMEYPQFVIGYTLKPLKLEVLKNLIAIK